MLNAPIDKEYLKTEILPKYTKLIEAYKFHMKIFPSISKQVDKRERDDMKEETVEHVIEEYQIEEGETFNVANRFDSYR